MIWKTGIHLVCLTILWGATSNSAEPARTTTTRPDILLIMPDQMRGDCLSILKHPAVCTPTLDQLARQGVLFRRTYTTVPSCIPARYALMTGLYPQTSGVVGYRQHTIRTPTLPQLLHDLGYITALVGRNMHQAANAAELGYELEISGSTYVPDDIYAADLKKAVPEMDNIRAWVAELGLSYNLWQARPWPLARALHPTTWVANKARQVVSKTSNDRPLFLTASFYAPHPPLFPPPEYFAAYMQKKMPQPAHGNWVAWDELTRNGTVGGHRVLLEGNSLQRAQAGYFGLIEHLDHELKPLLAEFKARSEAAGRPWVIVFTSDHGEMLGDHGYFRKCEPFEGAANIPLIIAGSTDFNWLTNGRCRQPVCLEDILPTLVSLAGGSCPKVDGINLLPVLLGNKPIIRPWLHFEHATCYSKMQAFQALTDGQFKYIWRPHDGTELLFDLDQDPHEEHDLSADKTWQDEIARWRSRLVARLANRPERFSDGQRLIPGRPYPPLQASAR